MGLAEGWGWVAKYSCSLVCSASGKMGRKESKIQVNEMLVRRISKEFIPAGLKRDVEMKKHAWKTATMVMNTMTSEEIEEVAEGNVTPEWMSNDILREAWFGWEPKPDRPIPRTPPPLPAPSTPPPPEIEIDCDDPAVVTPVGKGRRSDPSTWSTAKVRSRAADMYASQIFGNIKKEYDYEDKPVGKIHKKFRAIGRKRFYSS